MRKFRIIALILAAAMLLPVLVACNKTSDGEESSLPADTTAEQTEPAYDFMAKFTSNGEPLYTIVRSIQAENYAVGFANELKARMNEATGVKFTLTVDYDNNVDNTQRLEILVGDTNRVESQRAMEELAGKGGYIVREDGNKLVIAALDEMNLALAVTEFEQLYLGAENATSIGFYSPETAIPAGYDKVSAATEELLTVKEGFDYTEAYKVNFVGATNTAAPTGEIKTGLIASEYDTLYNVVAELNVLSFGAKGDGKTDDTEAFKAALREADARGGCVIFVPKGYYCLTDSLTVGDNVSIVGEIKPGTAEGTVLCIYGGKGSTDPAKSAFLMGPNASIQNLAIWYPEQTFVNGEPIPYPATIKQEWIDGVAVRNVTFVNSYYGIDYTGAGIYALQYTRDIYGTFLHLGYRNDRSLDIGKLENFHFSPDYWLESGLPGVPDAELLKTYMIRNSTGIIIERIDWTYITDIYIEGYCKGLVGRRSYSSDDYSGVTNGQAYNVNITDTYSCIFIEDLSWLLMTGGTFKATGNEGAAAVRYISTCGGNSSSNQPGDISFIDCVIESAGKSAVVNHSAATLSYTSCTLSSSGGSIVANMTGAVPKLLNCSFNGNNRGCTVLSDDTLPTRPDVDYTKDVVTKPKSNAYINITEAPYNAKENEDVTAILQKALDDLKATGGTVYIPSGIYYLSAGIDVWAGIELRGSTIAPGYAHLSATGTKLYTDFGKNDPNGEALIDLYEGAGIFGISIIYDKQAPASLRPYSYSIRGKGSNVYVVDVSTSTSYNGIDFASYRCDNHYIEFVWGVGLNNAIAVGAGSENGIIRDCHFTTNCWYSREDVNYWSQVFNKMMNDSTTFLIGESKNEILYNNFTICIKKGIELLDGAENVQVLGLGVDSSDIAVSLKGNCTAEFVNSQLVNLRDEGTATNFDIILSNEDFTGCIKLFNTSTWGTTKTAYNLKGEGKVYVIGGRTGRCDDKIAKVNNGEIYFYSYNNSSKSSVHVGEGAKKAYFSGNLFTSSALTTAKKMPQTCGPDVEN